MNIKIYKTKKILIIKKIFNHFVCKILMKLKKIKNIKKKKFQVILSNFFRLKRLIA